MKIIRKNKTKSELKFNNSFFHLFHPKILLDSTFNPVIKVNSEACAVSKMRSWRERCNYNVCVCVCIKRKKKILLIDGITGRPTLPHAGFQSRQAEMKRGIRVSKQD